MITYIVSLSKSYSCCNLSLHQRGRQGHLLIYFSLSLCGTNALNSTNFPSINCIRQMEFFHRVSKSCWARLMFFHFPRKTLAVSSLLNHVVFVRSCGQNQQKPYIGNPVRSPLVLSSIWL